MKLELIVLGVISLIELCLWFKPAWYIRKYIAGVCLLSLSLTSGLIFGKQPDVWTFIIFVAAIYRIVNLLRLIEGRTQADYLHNVARKTSFYLISIQAIAFGLYELNRHETINHLVWRYALVGFQLVAVLVLLYTTIRHLNRTRPPKVKDSYANRDLPALTVAIPARNETEDLEQCLATLVGSDYPKLEILVLDDCSQNKHTPEIIKAYAQAGVRFIAGNVPPDNWLAKNYAYEQLFDQASSELILFCGVDTRFETRSLRTLVECMLEKKKSMISLIPVNKVSNKFSLAKLLIQPSRYAWEITLPRRLIGRPAVLSTCWLIKTDLLKSAGGFKAVTRNVAIESFFARKAIAQADSYSFMQSADLMGVVSVKAVSDQLQTALRTRYPQMHRRPEMAMFFSLVEAAVLLGPIYSVVAGLVMAVPLLTFLGAVCLILNLFIYAKVIELTYKRFSLVDFLALPFAAVYDIGLLNYSMCQYEFGEVLWKGRNVCLPIMRVTSDLPPV